MRIAIDISPLDSGHKVRGVGFYVKYLKDALERCDSIHEFEFVKDLKYANSPDLLHIPFFDPFSRHLPLLKRFPTVITIHDLTPIKFSSHFPVGIRGNAIWKINERIVSRMNAIITDSNCSSSDVIEIMGVPSNKVHSVYLAPGDAFREPISLSEKKTLIKKFQLPKQFVLYVGDVTWNKNVPRIVEAAKMANVPIVLVGKAIGNKEYDKSHPWNKDLVKVQDLLFGYDHAKVLGFVEDKDLAGLYQLTTALLLPSLYEGFGLPVVEAMASGCPVITSREGSLPEVGANAVYYVDPYSLESIADGITDVFGSKTLQSQLKKSGIIQSEKFSWEKTAHATIDVYEKVALGR